MNDFDNSRHIEIEAKLVIDKTAILGMLSALQVDAPQPEHPAEKKKRGWPKGKKRQKQEAPPVVPPAPAPAPTPEPTTPPATPEAPVEQIRLRIDAKVPVEDQIKSAIIQAAMHTHGDAIARKIMTNWEAADSNSVATCRQIFPDVRLEAIAKATMDTSQSTLVKLPRLWLPALFDMANKLTAQARPVVAPVPTGCTICGSTGEHKTGCPVALMAATEGEGGAMVPRVANAVIEPSPASPEPEICAVNGAAGGCPLPHAMILQGGAHIPVHPPEVMENIRRATARQNAPAPVWNAPAPPASEASVSARKRGRPRKEK